ncbi:GntR family transcriptional regulator [Sphingomonas sp. BIUV-7]|uniref:GntR family transcriptional regulator n=1 Tax=Sphingomonas natans TaxID=3063330 RepID=A0ABT8YA83_9SPHN|nr:GntR family transcriptional regulator [Sphingomonas sp. BIUV-7]MDO6414614.1 GntR family transcriptional regulator [Sphingomonas sp. BIUV-7]
MHDLIRLDHETTRPLYIQLEEQLSQLIASGQIAGGTKLPSERQLAADLGVSRSTVQQSYSMLRERRLIVGQGRQGSTVPQEATKLRSGMDRLRGFTQEMTELGRRPSTRVLEQRIVSDRSVASLFGLPSTARFLYLVRVRLGDEVPLSRETAWYSLDAAPDLEKADYSGSIYGQLAAHNLIPAYCDQTIEATVPTASERDIFGFDEQVPCLLIKRRTYLRDGPMVEYVEGVFRGDTYIYRLRLDT